MGLDKQWVIELVVQEALADKAVLADPPQTPDDWRLDRSYWARGDRAGE